MPKIKKKLTTKEKEKLTRNFLSFGTIFASIGVIVSMIGNSSIIALYVSGTMVLLVGLFLTIIGTILYMRK